MTPGRPSEHFSFGAAFGSPLAFPFLRLMSWGRCRRLLAGRAVPGRPYPVGGKWWSGQRCHADDPAAVRASTADRHRAPIWSERQIVERGDTGQVELLE